METAVQTKRTKDVLLKYERHYNHTISIFLGARKGLKPQAVFDFINLSDFSPQLIEDILNKSIKTFTTYKQNNTSLDAVTSEKLLKLFSLYDKGTSIFGPVSEFNKWLSEPAFGLDNRVPSTLLDTITGIDLVKEELIRIEHGDLA